MRIETEDDRVTIIHTLAKDNPGLIVFCKIPSCRRLADLAVDYSAPDEEPQREYYCHYCYQEKETGE